MEEIIKNNIKFNSVPNTLSKGYSCLLTNTDNVSNNKYHYDIDSDPIITALDIDWCGAEVAPGKIINTSDDLLNWIKEISETKLSQEYIDILHTCKNLLAIITDFLIRNNNNQNVNYYWYAGINTINENTYPGVSSEWHLITDNNINSISTGELSNSTKINWVIAVPTVLNFNHISNGEDITDIYNVKTVTCADGVEYTVFTQVDASKKMDVEIIH